MTVTFISGANRPRTTASNVAFSKPGSISPGNLLLASVVVEALDWTVVPVESGWSVAGTSVSVQNGSNVITDHLFWKIQKEGDSETVANFLLPAGARTTFGNITAWQSDVGFPSSPVLDGVVATDSDFGDIIAHPNIAIARVNGLAVRNGSIHWAGISYNFAAGCVGHTARFAPSLSVSGYIVGSSVATKGAPTGSATSDNAGTTAGGVRVGRTTIITDEVVNVGRDVFGSIPI